MQIYMSFPNSMANFQCEFAMTCILKGKLNQHITLFRVFSSLFSSFFFLFCFLQQNIRKRLTSYRSSMIHHSFIKYIRNHNPDIPSQ